MNRKEMLLLPLKEKIKITNNIIKTTLRVAKKPIVQFSGGVDSCVMAWMINQIDQTVPMVFNDWGLFLPRTKKFVQSYFKRYKITYFIIDSGYNYKSFLKEKGMPIFKGIRTVVKKEDYHKYNITMECRKLKDICFNKFYKEYQFDYFYVGLLAAESIMRKVNFLKRGFVIPKKKNTIMVKPLALFTKSEIFKIVKDNNILWCREAYEYEFQGKTIDWHNKPELMDAMHSDLECFMCPVRFKVEGWGRIGYLARTHIKEFNEVMDLGMRKSLHGIVRDYPGKSDYILKFLIKYDKNFKNKKYGLGKYL